MIWLTEYFLLLALGFLLLARYAWGRSSLPAKAFLIMLVFDAFWAAGYGLEFLGATQNATWANAGFTFKMLGFHGAVLCGFLFSVAYVYRVKTNLAMVLASTSTVPLSLCMFNVGTGWYVRQLELGSFYQIATLRAVPEFGFVFGMFNSVLLLGASCVLLLFNIANLSDLYRIPARIAAIGFGIPVLLGFFSNAGIKQGLDWGAFGLIATLGGFIWALRLGLLERSPAAWSEALEKIEDPVLVTNTEGQLIHSNPAAQSVAAHLEFLKTELPEFEAVNLERTYAVRSGGFQALDTQAKWWVLRDISPLKKLESELRFEKERFEHLSIHDALTDLPNFRAFVEALEAIPQLQAKPLGLVMLDVDHFGKLNKAQGLGVGNNALCVIARWLEQEIPDEAQVFRFGGDEFCMLLPGFNLACTLEFAQKLLTSSQTVDLKGMQDFKFNVSLGVSALPEHPLSQLQALADEALKNAKKTRACLVVAPKSVFWGRGWV
jgi:diguanylate cyclase (GGDEF)-like protein